MGGDELKQKKEVFLGSASGRVLAVRGIKQRSFLSESVAMVFRQP